MRRSKLFASGRRALNLPIVPCPQIRRALAEGRHLRSLGIRVRHGYLIEVGMRPRIITAFEWIFLVTLGLGLIHSVSLWRQLTTLASPAFVIAIQCFTFLVMIGLVLAVSRRRSNIARWVLCGLFALGLPVFFGTLQHFDEVVRTDPLSWILMPQLVLQAVAIALLFTPAARRWFVRAAPPTTSP